MALVNEPAAQVPVVAQNSTAAALYVTPSLYNGAAYQATRQAGVKQQAQYLPQGQATVNHYIQGMMHDLVANLDLAKPSE